MADRSMTRALLPIAAVLAVVACGSDVVAPENINFVDELEIDLSVMTRTASGLYILDLTVGDGAVVVAGDTVVVDYGGWLPNGANFDSGTDTDFQVGVGSLIDGFDEGMIGMRVGGTRSFVIPPALGYGDQIVGGIPANSTLVFRVTLKGIL
jgi:FKBP-type peptidyl-prolyl cis-trans isomerase FkpA